MNFLLWVLQVLLAMAFLAHGWLFLFPPEDLVAVMNASIPPALRSLVAPDSESSFPGARVT